MTVGAGYALYPEVDVRVTQDSEPITAGILSLRSTGTTDYYAFFETLDDFQLLTPIGGGFVFTPSDMPRTTIQRLNS